MEDRALKIAIDNINGSWSVDFMPIALCNGRRIRALDVIDGFSRLGFGHGKGSKPACHTSHPDLGANCCVPWLSCKVSLAGFLYYRRSKRAWEQRHSTDTPNENDCRTWLPAQTTSGQGEALSKRGCDLEDIHMPNQSGTFFKDIETALVAMH